MISPKILWELILPMNDWAQTLTILLSIVGGFLTVTQAVFKAIKYLQTMKEGLDTRFNSLETRQRDMGQRIGELTRELHEVDKALAEFKSESAQNENRTTSLLRSAKYRFRDLGNRTSIIEKYLERKGARIIPGNIEDTEDPTDITEKDTFS